MFQQPKFRRTFSAITLTLLASVFPLSGLQARPLTRQQPATVERHEARDLPALWIYLVSLWEKLGSRIDDNGGKIGSHDGDSVLKFGSRIDDNG